MDPQEITINERSTLYDIKYRYHSDSLCENFDAEIIAIEESEGKVTIKPRDGLYKSFVFDHSDPDRVIAIANMIRAFAEMVKNDNKKTIDTSEKIS